MAFKDYFSLQSQDYARFRPLYPEALFQFLARQSPATENAWDCGTGNGQAATSLADFFSRVFATDPSSLQIEAASPRPNIEYRVAPAEDSGLPGRSMDCVTVAQALHWFRFDAFFAEVRRVCRPGALVIAWGYGLNSVTPAVDQVFHYFYSDVVGSFWPPERVLIEEQYRTIPFPFAPVSVPPFEMISKWNLYEFAGYLSTWSAVSRYRLEHKSDPLDLIESELIAAWGDPESRKQIRWPLFFLAGRTEA